MAEYIEREKVIKALHENTVEMERSYAYDSNIGVPKEDIEYVINEIPAADVVEVVRCKECAFRGDMGDCECWDSPLGEAGLFTDDDFYCSCGVRRSDNE